ncbi:MAG: hypothetical protein ACFWT2_15090 [Thermoanaerobacterium thermosaccharolyticum]
MFNINWDYFNIKNQTKKMALKRCVDICSV